MTFVEAIIRKRDGGKLTKEQVGAFVDGAASGTLPVEQLAAMLMAICVRGMDDEETQWLTRSMLESGESWHLADEVPGVIDKHSTGGVGDTVSLVLAPLLAAVGSPVAMMAGRGLAHSQGTLDKLESIPGFCCDRTKAETISLLGGCGAAIVAQSEHIAPADGVLYALRDVTGTVPSLPLIVASIMSKKLALGTAALVLDVKWGHGAFRKTVAEAGELAAALRGVAQGMGMACEAVITDMNQPLGPTLGTACEVRAALDVLGGAGSTSLREVSVELARTAMELTGADPDESELALVGALRDGSARIAWDRLVEAHDGDPDTTRLPTPSSTRMIESDRAGWVTAVAADSLGWIAVDLGAGRRTRDEAIDHGAGLEIHARIGDRIEPGQPLATILVGERPVDLEFLEGRVRDAITIADEPVESPTLILGPVEDLPD